MKKIILLSAFSFVGMINANPIKLKGTIKSDISKNTVAFQQQNNKFTEYKVVSINGDDTCYVRDCRTREQDNGDGTTTEVKVCGPWVQVTCPTPPDDPHFS